VIHTRPSARIPSWGGSPPPDRGARAGDLTTAAFSSRSDTDLDSPELPSTPPIASERVANAVPRDRRRVDSACWPTCWCRR
jgi:hypothetical protein